MKVSYMQSQEAIARSIAERYADPECDEPEGHLLHQHLYALVHKRPSSDALSGVHARCDSP